MPSQAEQILTRHHRFELLDAMRGVGALFVATFHAPPTMQRFVPFPFAYLAVDLFFCLSGFVIAFSYEDRLQKGMPFREFFIARVIRLYPLYFLGLLLGVLAFLARSHFLLAEQQSETGILAAFLLGLAMLPSFGGHVTTSAFPLNPPSWSLFFEVFINLVFAALVLFGLARSRYLVLAAVTSLAFTFHFGLLHSAGFDVGSSADLHFLYGFYRVSYSFFVGVLLFRVFRAVPSLRVPDRFNASAALAVLAAILFILTESFRFASGLGYQFFLVTFFMPVLIFIGAGVRVDPRWKHACLFFGEFSYPLYILHLPLLAPLYLAHRLHMTGPLYQALAPGCVIALTFVARWVALHYDAPVRKYLGQKSAALRRRNA